MSDSKSYSDFEKILFQDLSSGVSLRKILEHIRVNFQLSIFILSLDCRPIMFSADQLLTTYFPHLYENGDEVICYSDHEAAKLKLNELFGRNMPSYIKPGPEDDFCTVLFPIKKDAKASWIMIIKYSDESKSDLAGRIAPVLSELCAAYLSEGGGALPDVRSSADTTIARELIVFDSPASGNLSLEQFKLQYDALFSAEKMSQFSPPFIVCAFLSLESEPDDSSYTQALSEIEEQFPNSFSIVSRGIMYAFVFNCGNFRERQLENFCYQLQLRVGVSDMFDSLEDRHFFKKQANELLKIDSNGRQGKYVYSFFENYTQLLLKNAVDRFGAETLILSDGHRLLESDRENGTNNAQTLWQYLRCFSSPTAAAKALFIDRSTLHYRLQRITESYKVNMDDPHLSQAAMASLWIEMHFFNNETDQDKLQ